MKGDRTEPRVERSARRGARPGEPIRMDGRRLARARAARLAARAAAVLKRRGRPPRLSLIAFAGPDGRAANAERKVRACTAAGVAVAPRVLSAGTATGAVRAAVAAALADDAPDAVFVEFPFPPDVDGDAVMECVPEALDVDVMTPGRIRRYLEDASGPPPLTVTAALELLDGYAVDVAGLAGVVVAEVAPFAEMFRTALARRGARMAPVVPPTAPDLEDRLREARLVVVAAGSPGLVRAASLAAGAVAIDAGYFNPGGRGDIDVTGGTAHLAAFAPVPGGIGPMTVSALVERVIEFSERAGDVRG
ncbi:MAG TPA: tetrahydrofolate dehydrogenase/cyclohydrolase catalytic domain-containing protein [Longimicrobiales bacterium]